MTRAEVAREEFLDFALEEHSRLWAELLKVAPTYCPDHHGALLLSDGPAEDGGLLQSIFEAPIRDRRGLGQIRFPGGYAQRTKYRELRHALDKVERVIIDAEAAGLPGVFKTRARRAKETEMADAG